MATDTPPATPVPNLCTHIAERRSALPEAERLDLSERPWGLALSGGGIRSATFCFGLLKALAAGGLLHRFDLMSTVSGGGYIGATVGKLFQNEAGAADPASALQIEQAIADADTRWFATWLRANGRYLIPRGSKDTFFAAANFGRNFLGVHIELAIVSALLAGVLVGIDLAVWQFADCVFSHGQCLGFDRDQVAAFGWLTHFPTVWVLLLPIVWLSMVVACAYWSLPSRKDRPVEWPRVATAVLMTLAFLVVVRHATHALDGRFPRWTGSLELPGLLVVAALATLAAWVFGIGLAVIVAGIPGKTLDWARNWLTGSLSMALGAFVAVGGLGAVDHLAFWLGNLHAAMQGTFGVGVLLAAVALRAALPKIGDLPKSLAPTARRIVLPVIDAAGVLLLVLVIVFWMSLVHRATSSVLFGTEPAELRFGPAWQWLAWLVVPPFLLAALSANNREFMNRSSLYTFYRARLVRSYLGAANAKRFTRGSSSPTSALSRPLADQVPSDVGDVDPDDDLPMSAYAPHRAGGPVHLINACINQTRDPNGGLFNQDRKGLLLTVGPNGQMRTQADGWQLPGNEACMTLGSWIAISGAAIAPGLGASTRSGIASILTLAGLRLGYWWDSTSLARPPGRRHPRLGKYAQLFSELQGRFDGDSRRDWFLSDGGHFENTATYALLREECELIVMADCGADPRYVFADLENLVRKARIDLQADITFLRPREPDAAIAAFGSLNDLASTDSDACLALARIDYRHSGKTGHLFIVKPNMCHGVSVDLVNFKADNPLFPQEPTTDQFFSEAQWESYFQLGQTLGGKLSLPPMTDAARFARVYFVDDDGAVLVQGDDGQKAVRFSSKRLSSRVVSTGAVSASISLGAVASIGLAAWQGVSTEIDSTSRAAIIEPAAYKELTDIFGKLPPPAAGAATVTSTVIDRDTRLGEMATALLRVGDAACTDSNLEAFRRSKLMRLMVDSTRDGCRQSESPHWSCADLLDDNKLPACLQVTPRNICTPLYWTRDYASASLDAANCWSASSQSWVGPNFLPTGPPPAPPPIPAAAAPTPTPTPT
ncbi:MAG: hypothetical protein JWQ11_4679, partial [Rhizobacter sp.]|nr:hypothetical protein [Rhizobacter sp.]